MRGYRVGELWDGLHGDCAEGGDLRPETGNLARTEVVHARVIGIVHVVVDGYGLGR